MTQPTREPVLRPVELARLRDVLADKRKLGLADMAFLAEVQQRFEAREREQIPEC